MFALLLTPLLAFLISAPAGAETAAPSDVQMSEYFKASARSLTQNLLHQGYRSFGRLNLDSVLRFIDEPIEIRVVDGLKHQVDRHQILETARSTADWLCPSGEGKIIRVNRRTWPHRSTEVRSVIALHEYLGCMRFNDRDYILSTALWFLSLDRTSTILQTAEKRVLVSVVSAQAGGGITGVGGGGDSEGVEVRMALLREGLNRLSHSPPDLRKQIFAELLQSFSLRKEVIWRGPRPTGTYTSSPSEIANRVALVEVCQKFMALPEEQQIEVFALVQKGNSPASRRLQTLEDFKNSCLSVLKGD